MNLSSKTSSNEFSEILKDRQQLLKWYQRDQRDLPWRKSRDPYRVWLSEIMLQQTTVKAVIPYYERFLKKFPTVDRLAAASQEDVYELWAGLGYYSRARSLRKAAQEIVERGAFPSNHQDLLDLPGLGDYTARAVASIAFGEKVGVVDGNVIRVLSRRWNQPWEHWRGPAKREIQALSDTYASTSKSDSVNQALMELGSTICRPVNPTCILCPWKARCRSLQSGTIDQRPLKKPKRQSEIWQWNAALVQKNGRIAVVNNQYAPFLKNQWILPGYAQKKNKAPKNFHFKHGITHHHIFVTTTRERSNFLKNWNGEILWLFPKQLKQKAPFSLVQKAVAFGLDDNKLNSPTIE